MNSPWDPISCDSSRRSSFLAEQQIANSSSSGGNISQQLQKLHRKAATFQHQSGRQSAMSDVSNNEQQQQQQQNLTGAISKGTMRRASDPVRSLAGHKQDMQRHKSYQNLGAQQQQMRMPLHGQNISQVRLFYTLFTANLITIVFIG